MYFPDRGCVHTLLTLYVYAAAVVYSGVTGVADVQYVYLNGGVGGQQVARLSVNTSSSTGEAGLQDSHSLIISSARRSDTGHYDCYNQSSRTVGYQLTVNYRMCLYTALILTVTASNY